MSEQKTEKSQRLEILLAALYLFIQRSGDKEISRSEFVECISEFQKEFPLGYEFAESFLCSLELFTDLDDLWLKKGYIQQYRYRCRNTPLSPKNFIALKLLGRGHAKKIIEALSSEIIEGLNKAIEIAIENYQKRWG